MGGLPVLLRACPASVLVLRAFGGRFSAEAKIGSRGIHRGMVLFGHLLLLTGNFNRECDASTATTAVFISIAGEIPHPNLRISCAMLHVLLYSSPAGKQNLQFASVRCCTVSAQSLYTITGTGTVSARSLCGFSQCSVALQACAGSGHAARSVATRHFVPSLYGRQSVHRALTAQSHCMRPVSSHCRVCPQSLWCRVGARSLYTFTAAVTASRF